MIRLGVGTTISRLASSVGRFQALDWALGWSSTTGTNQGSGTGQQYRGARMDGNGRIWAAGGSVAYSGAATPVQDISTDALTVTPGPTGQKVNFIGVGHNAGTGAHEVAGIFGNTNNYARAYAVTHDVANGITYIGGRAGEHMPTTAGAYQEAFQGDSNPNSLYGPQDGYIIAVNSATGAVLYASYFGVAAAGDLLRDIIFHNGYVYGMYSRFATSGTPGMAVRIVKIEPDLSDILATFDFGNDASTSGGQGSLTARGETLWAHFNTTTAVTNGVPTAGAFQDFGSGSHTKCYIGRFDLSEGGLDFVQATYVRTVTGTSPLTGPTHTIDWIPRNGGSIVAHLGGANSTCDLPVYGTPQFQNAAGPQGNSYLLEISDTLEGNPTYGTYIHTDTSGERVAGSSIAASRDGKRLLLPFEVNSSGWDALTTDDSTVSTGVNTGLAIIFRIPEDGVGWETEMIAAAAAPSAYYASEFDAAGNAYVGGFLTNSANPIPILHRYTPSIPEPPPPSLTAPTTETAIVDGVSSSASTSVTVTIPASVDTGDWLLISAVHRKDGTLQSSIGTQVGSQASDFSNHEMAVWQYEVTDSDVPGTTTFTVSSTSTFTNFSVCVVPVTGTGGVDDDAGPGVYGLFGDTGTAPSVTTTSTNSRAYCFISGVTNETYTPQSGAVEVAEATTGTAGLYVFSYLQEEIGATGTLDATTDGGGTANHYGCTIAMKGT